MQDGVVVSGDLASNSQLRFIPAGDSALIAEFGSAITPELNAQVIALDRELSAALPRGIIELVPTYRSLMVVYDSAETGFADIKQAVAAAADRCIGNVTDRGRRWTVPVYYGDDLGDDLEEVASYTGISASEVVQLHSDAEFRVYMIGFAPGFTYLGGLPDCLHIPRRKVPRPRVEAGSIMIGGIQAGIASVAVPTGWYVIGRTPVRAFDMNRTRNVFLFHTGDIVRFEPVCAAEFESLEVRAALGEPVARQEA